MAYIIKGFAADGTVLSDYRCLDGTTEEWINESLPNVYDLPGVVRAEVTNDEDPSYKLTTEKPSSPQT